MKFPFFCLVILFVDGFACCGRNFELEGVGSRIFGYFHFGPEVAFIYFDNFLELGVEGGIGGIAGLSIFHELFVLEFPVG